MHDIFGQRFESREKPAWHGLGHVFDADEEVALSDAVARVAGDLTFRAAPLYYFDSKYGRGVRIKDKFMVVREPTEDDDRMREMGIAGDKWQVQQYTEYAAHLDALSDKYPVETAGVFGTGEHMFFSLRGPSMSISGRENFREDIENYFVGDFWQKPGNAHGIIHTPVRPVCQNTLTLAQKSANIAISIPHNGDPAATMKFVARLVGDFDKHVESVREIFSRFASVRIDAHELEEICMCAFPNPSKPRRVRMLETLDEQTRMALLSEAKQRMVLETMISAESAWLIKIERAQRMRQAMVTLAEKFNDEHPQVANTVWSAYNAATELADWREGREQSIGESVLYGPRMREKERAYKACYSLIS